MAALVPHSSLNRLYVLLILRWPGVSVYSLNVKMSVLVIGGSIKKAAREATALELQKAQAVMNY